MALDVPTKGMVKRAGEILKDESPDIFKHTEALDVLSKWRSLHRYPINTFQAMLRSKVKALNFEDAIVAQRLKRLPSIEGKLKRWPDMKLDRMQDIGGVRVILNSMDEVYALHDNLINNNNKRFEHEAELPARDYIKNPKLDGYRCLHQVFRYNSRDFPELKGMRIELQIRTKMQHSWATAVETLGIIEKSSFKTGEGDVEHKRFFLLSSALFARHELQPMPSILEDKSYPEIIEEFMALEARLQVFVKLRSIAEVAKKIDSVSSNKNTYHVMEMEIANESININLTPFSKTQVQKAEEYYSLREARTKDSPNIEVVLISVGSLSEIKKAYPNYFLDTNLFVDNLTHLCEIYRHELIKSQLSRKDAFWSSAS